jgi:hypothetical protein
LSSRSNPSSHIAGFSQKRAYQILTPELVRLPANSTQRAKRREESNPKIIFVYQCRSGRIIARMTSAVVSNRTHISARLGNRLRIAAYAGLRTAVRMRCAGVTSKTHAAGELRYLASCGWKRSHPPIETMRRGEGRRILRKRPRRISWSWDVWIHARLPLPPKGEGGIARFGKNKDQHAAVLRNLSATNRMRRSEVVDGR